MTLYWVMVTKVGEEDKPQLGSCLIEAEDLSSASLQAGGIGKFFIMAGLLEDVAYEVVVVEVDKDAIIDGIEKNKWYKSEELIELGCRTGNELLKELAERN